MKKFILTIALVLLVTFGLVACGKKNGDDKEPVDDEPKYDLGGIDFVIRANDAKRTDPRNPEYERLYRNEKTVNIANVEDKYNVNVVYLNYPSNASWGVSRDNWIIEQARLGITESHVYEISSNSVATLAVQGAILPLDEYIEEYGNPGLWQKKKDFGTILGKKYVYDDVYSMNEEGIFYNSELLGRLLGETRKIEPTELWLNGEWTWEKFYELAVELNQIIQSSSFEEPMYVIGGKTYEWLYPMVGSNGSSLVDSNFQSHLADDAVLETLEFLSSLRTIEGMWIDDAPLHLTHQPEFRAQRNIFHTGSDWYLADISRWGNLEFDLDFVPYPVGPRAQEDPDLYFYSKVMSEPAFVISSAFSKDRIPAGYEDMFLHDEIIFKIWSEIVHFPEIDPATGEASLDEIKDNYYSTRLLPQYAHEESRIARLEVLDKAKVDHFYSITESLSQNESGYMLRIESAIKSGEIRSSMVSLNNELQQTLNARLLGK